MKLVWRRVGGRFGRKKKGIRAKGRRGVYLVYMTSARDMDAMNHGLVWTLRIGRFNFGCARTRAKTMGWAEGIDRKGNSA